MDWVENFQTNVSYTWGNKATNPTAIYPKGLGRSIHLQDASKNIIEFTLQFWLQVFKQQLPTFLTKATCRKVWLATLFQINFFKIVCRTPLVYRVQVWVWVFVERIWHRCKYQNWLFLPSFDVCKHLFCFQSS